MGVVLPASAGLVDLLSLFFFVIDVKSQSMGCLLHVASASAPARSSAARAAHRG
jgi:hypothetical protein